MGPEASLPRPDPSPDHHRPGPGGGGPDHRLSFNPRLQDRRLFGLGPLLLLCT